MRAETRKLRAQGIEVRSRSLCDSFWGFLARCGVRGLEVDLEGPGWRLVALGGYAWSGRVACAARAV